MHSFSTKLLKNNQPSCYFLFPEQSRMGMSFQFSSATCLFHFHICFAYHCRRGRLAKTAIVLQMLGSYEPSPLTSISRELHYHQICSLHCQTIMEGCFSMHLLTAEGDDRAIYDKQSLPSNNNTAWLLFAAGEKKKEINKEKKPIVRSRQDSSHPCAFHAVCLIRGCDKPQGWQGAQKIMQSHSLARDRISNA